MQVVDNERSGRKKGMLNQITPHLPTLQTPP